MRPNLFQHRHLWFVLNAFWPFKSDPSCALLIFAKCRRFDKTLTTFQVIALGSRTWCWNFSYKLSNKCWDVGWENLKMLSLSLSLSAWHFDMDKKFAHRSIMQDRQTGEPIKTLASPSSCSEENLGWCIRFCWHKNHKILSIIIRWWWTRSIILISKKIYD